MAEDEAEDAWEVDGAEFAATVAMLLTGRLGDPARYVELQGITVTDHENGDVDVATRDGTFRLTVTRLGGAV